MALRCVFCEGDGEQRNAVFIINGMSVCTRQTCILLSSQPNKSDWVARRLADYISEMDDHG